MRANSTIEPRVPHEDDRSDSDVALNIKNSEVEQLATDVAALGQTSKTEAIRVALLG